MLAGPLPGIYDPTGPGKPLFGFFAAMAETERENIRESTLEGLDTAARKGKYGGRPPVMTDDMLHTVLRRSTRRVRRADPTRPDHPHRQAQGTEPVRRQHLPGPRRTREDPGIPRGRRDSTRRLRRPSAARPQPQVVTQRYTPPGGGYTRTGPSRWRRPPSVFSCASCAASAARPPWGGVRPEACDGSHRRGGKGARACHRVTGSPGLRGSGSGETVRPRLGEKSN
jgi:hypothetical protein